MGPAAGRAARFLHLSRRARPDPRAASGLRAIRGWQGAGADQIEGRTVQPAIKASRKGPYVRGGMGFSKSAASRNSAMNCDSISPASPAHRRVVPGSTSVAARFSATVTCASRRSPSVWASPANLSTSGAVIDSSRSSSSATAATLLSLWASSASRSPSMPLPGRGSPQYQPFEKPRFPAQCRSRFARGGQRMFQDG